MYSMRIVLLFGALSVLLAMDGQREQRGHEKVP